MRRERIRSRTRAKHIVSCGKAFHRRSGDLAVRPAVVLDFGPRLRRFVEELQGEFRHAAEHLHQASLEVRPEAFLLAVLVGTVGQRLLMEDPQPQQPCDHFVGDHRRAVVGQQRTGQTAFLDRLREPVHEVLSGLGEIPLQMAAQTRVIVEDAQGDGTLPLAAGSEHLERAVMEIEMPERPDILGFVTADLAFFATLLRAGFAGTAVGRRPRLADHAMRLHVPADRRVRTEPPQRRIGLHRRGEVVIVQLVGPVRMVLILSQQVQGQCRSQRDLAAVLADRALEGADRVVLLPRAVVPPLDRGGGEADLAAADRMCPGLRSERSKDGLEFSMRRRRRSAASPPPRIGSEPTRLPSRNWVLRSSNLLTDGVKGTITLLCIGPLG